MQRGADFLEVFPIFPFLPIAAHNGDFLEKGLPALPASDFPQLGLKAGKEFFIIAQLVNRRVALGSGVGLFQKLVKDRRLIGFLQQVEERPN